MIQAPYSPDVRAKGWRFELDHERIRQSDTWALAPAELRPWLLMLWMVAWEQTPCGSLPIDDNLIAARIGMNPKSFTKAREILMRGWIVADDGRLYHPTLTERVIEMIEKRRKDAERRGRNRAGHTDGHAVVPRDTAGTDTGQSPDGGLTTTGRTVPEPEPVEEAKAKEKKRAAPALGLSELLALGVEQGAAADWLKVRAAKRAPLTQTVLDALVREAGKANLSVADAVRISAERNWQGFNADWLTPEIRGSMGRRNDIAAAEQHNAAVLAKVQGTRAEPPFQLQVVGGKA